jgi:subtilase family serine protease
MIAILKKIHSGLLILLAAFFVNVAASAQKSLPGHVPAAVSRLISQSRLAPTNSLTLAIGLPLRNETALDQFIQQLTDPQSPNYHKFITPAEFAARFGPSEADYLAVKNFALTNGFQIIGTHSNRLVLDVQVQSGDAERAFHITLRNYRHPQESRIFFAPDTEPTVPTNLPVADVWGLSDYGTPKPMSHLVDPLKIKSLGGSGPSGYYAGKDFRNAYVPGTPLTGAGQTVGLLQFSDYFKSDVTNYQKMIGLTNFIPLNNIVLPGGTPSTANNNEVALDIEMSIAMAPQLSQVIVYEIKSVNPSSILSRMASDNLAKQLSSSWSWSGGPTVSVDNALKQMITQGQSFFQASGDSDAYTGAQILDNSAQINAPVSSTNLTCVGGTTLTMNGSGVSWSSEKVWNYNAFGGTFANVGSGGGVSTYYGLPYWQTNLDPNVTQGSATFRNIPDVALTGDGVSVCYTSGSTAVTNPLAGTSCAAPLWAGFCALLNQQSVVSSGTTVGFLNPVLYNLAATTNYANCFHDITQGNNIGTNLPGFFNATTGYDLATGLGTPNGVNLINTLAPSPGFISQPSSRNVTFGANVLLSASAVGQPPLNFQWLLNGTNLPGSGTVSGVTTDTLSLTTVTTNDIGSYSLVLTNAYGSITSSVALLNVGAVPSVLTQPTNLTLLTGSVAIFSVSASGSPALSFQWKKNGSNLVNGTGISGATTNVLSLTGITTNSSANYSLVITNVFGVVTSSIAVLNVVLPPTISSSSLTNRTLECGSNVSYTVTLGGTTPLAIQWSLDGSPLAGATNSTLTLTNVHLPNHNVAVLVTNLYAALNSNVVLTVRDTLAPVITLNGLVVLTNELGSPFIDLGASALDACAGPVPVITNGMVNINIVGTNTLTYQSIDGNGNTNSIIRTVIVRDTVAPTISWSFTNLVLVADTNCGALMTNVTGTNFILATDLSGTLTITQNPTNGAVLSLGTNLVVLTVADASGNKSYATNRIVVRDQTPPVISLNGSSLLTNELGVAFIDPGVTYSDSCSGIFRVTTNGVVNIGIVSTNTLTYTATDVSGNTNTVTRTIMIRDTTPPMISWSFTNIVLTLDTNCSAIMPVVTGTNFIRATDLSGSLLLSQLPSSNSVLALGTNVVLISVSDAAGNVSFSTNFIIVRDTAPPLITSQPLSKTNIVGETATFSVVSTACTAQSFQWRFNGSLLTNQTGAALTLSNVTALSVGNYFVVVTSAGGSVTSLVATLQVNLLASSLALVSSSNPDGFRDSVSFAVAVSPTNATGAIQFFTNGATFNSQLLTAGFAGSPNISNLPRGTNLITAIYSGDNKYLRATNSIAQIVTNHPPFVLPAFYTLIAGSDLSVPVSDLATNWSDADGDVLSIASVGISTNGLIVTNAALSLLYSNPSYVDDQFVCVIGDGFGGTNFQTVSITVVPQTNSTPNIAGVLNRPSGLQLKLSGAYGLTYVLEAATDLLSGTWQPMATNTLDVTGVWQFTDEQVTNFPGRFYRLKLMP